MAAGMPEHERNGGDRDKPYPRHAGRHAPLTGMNLILAYDMNPEEVNHLTFLRWLAQRGELDGDLHRDEQQ